MMAPERAQTLAGAPDLEMHSSTLMQASPASGPLERSLSGNAIVAWLA